MTNLYKSCLSLMVAFGLYGSSMGQSSNPPLSLGKSKSLLTEIKQESISSAFRKTIPAVELKTPDNQVLNGKINYKQSETSSEYVMGEISGVSGSSFHLKVSENSVEGNIVMVEAKKAYTYYSDAQGNAFVKEVDINTILCIEYDHAPAKEEPVSSEAPLAVAALNDLQSLPGANGCVLLDFDGYYMPAGNLWNGGNAINAAASGMSDAAVQECWEVVSEDYRPFNLNITTNEAVFNSYPRNRRMRCVITPTNTAAPGAGGVAYIGSFNWDNDVPCWVFITSGKAGGEASSHEIGHTFGLGHDGRTNPSEGYFAGHGDWAPIMGVGYYEPISQWSRGEYNYANNGEDDLAMISSSTYGVGYRNDDHGNATSAATSIGAGSNVNRYGIIERTSDVDYFSFNSGSGTINLNVNTVSRHGDLDIIVRLFNSSGGLIGTYNPAGLNASLSVNVGQGTYYLSVDNTGAGNPATDGYSDYASLGSYWITGSIPVPSNPPSADGAVTVYKDCNFTGTAVGLDEGDYTFAQLQAKGIMNDDISSLRVKYGFKIIVYADDNFTGSSLTFNAEDGCLVDNGFNDIVTSLRVRADGLTNLAGTYYVQNRNSNLYMDVWGISTADGAEIKQGGFNGNANQQFEFVHLGDGVYKITAKHSGKSFDINAISTDNFAKLIQWTYVGGNNQKFIIKDAGAGYLRLIAKHSSRILEVGYASLDNGATINQYDNNGQTCGQWKLVPVTTSSTVIQAESFSAMAGIQTEATTDAGGGSNVGWIDAGDWMAYNSINFPTSGAYLVEYRVASMSGGQLSLDLNAGSIQLGTLNVPATGGWQTWTTISHTVNVNAGTYNVGIFAPAGGWNINWFRITKTANAQASPIASAALLEATFEYYPNPTEDILSVRSEVALSGGLVNIYDAMGSEVISAVVADESVVVASLKPGIYTLVINKDGNKVSRRFIKR